MKSDESVCVCVCWNRPRIKKERRERVELTFLDACWSMHGSMVDINEVACIKSTPFFLGLGFGPRIWKEERIFGLYCP